jgi:hypothetical protein
MDTLTIADLSIPVVPGPSDWNPDGYVILKKALPDDLIDAYRERWVKDNWPSPSGHMGKRPHRPGGYDYCTPYMDVPELADLASTFQVHREMRALTGEPMGMHLNLSGWVTTERDWHQDTYLNPPHVGDYYAAAWMALEDIHPDSGPFQFVPGSHRWFEVTQEKMWEALEPHERHDPQWPKYSERLLTPLFEQEIASRGVPIVSYLPQRGDVLLWHSRLVHRGSKANIPGYHRRALIVHYSGIHHRPDMPQPPIKYRDGWVFPIAGHPPV